MHHTEISEGIIQLTANVEPNSLLFESMWPIPHGVSLNSYIIRGEQSAIIDGFCGWDGVPETLFALFDEINLDINSIDYVIINHMEPDHSGWIEAFKKIRPHFQIVATAAAEATLRHYMGLTDEYRKVKSGDTIDLGQGKCLAFYEIPNVHWPETMVTYETSSKVLFSCDNFGMFGTVSHKTHYDSQTSATQMDHYMRETLRYYANILGAFSYSVQKSLVTLQALDINIIAPGHGLMWQDAKRGISEYARLASYSKGPAKEKVTILWGSMYGATEMAVQPLADAITEQGVDVAIHRVPHDHISYVLQSIWESSAVAIGMPTYEYKMFPPMCAALDEIFKKKVLNRKALHFGSYGWSGGAKKELDEMVQRSKCKWDFIDSIEFQGRPQSDDTERIQKAGRELVVQMKAWRASSAN